jgi:hypothetical protein
MTEQTETRTPTPGENRLWRVLLVSMAILPALVSVWTAFRLQALFESIAMGGAATLAKSLAELQTPVTATLAVASGLALVLGLVQTRRPSALSSIERILFWAGPLASVVPVFLLWRTTGLLLEFVVGTTTRPVVDFAKSIANTLLLCQLSGGVVALALFIASVVIASGGRDRTASASRVAGIGALVAALLFASLSATFYFRSTELREVALRSLPPTTSGGR